MPRGKHTRKGLTGVEGSWVDLEVERRNYERRAAKYGVTPDDLIRMKARQGGLCAICNDGGELVIDHDHETGEVRGLLCAQCNSGLGMFRERPAALAAAIYYLGRANGLRPDVRSDLPIYEPSLYAAHRIQRRSLRQKQRDRRPPTDQEGETPTVVRFSEDGRL